MSTKFHRRFSIPHFDLVEGEHEYEYEYYTAFKNSSDEFKREIHDIYFGGEFIYELMGVPHRFGEVMGAIPSSSQVDSLFRIQEEFGVPISLTLNSLNTHHSLASNAQVVDEFIEWLNAYYVRGLRSCTISATHLMRTGKLQEAFPDMNWKNTVNHQVKTTQEVYDYAALGYTTILLDRSLNRDIETLKEIYVESKKLGIKTSLLATENCMPSCPFKVEHDSWQASTDYWRNFTNTCSLWRKGSAGMPRIGTNIALVTKELVDLFFDNVDILKFSGRLRTAGSLSPAAMLTWHRPKPSTPETLNELEGDVEMAPSFAYMYDRNLAPFFHDTWHIGAVSSSNIFLPPEESTVHPIWSSKKGKTMGKLLASCRNRCWDCHACEKVWKVPPFDSIIDLPTSLNLTNITNITNIT